jgi:hypothetical protein
MEIATEGKKKEWKSLSCFSSWEKISFSLSNSYELSIYEKKLNDGIFFANLIRTRKREKKSKYKYKKTQDGHLCPKVAEHKTHIKLNSPIKTQILSEPIQS